MKSNRTLASLVALLLAAGLTGCLKTRAQLKEEPEGTSPGAPQPAEVQDVEPKGQYVIDEIKGEITRLTGRVEELERQAQANAGTPAQKEEQKKLENRIQELETAQAAMIEQIKKLQAQAPVADSPELFEKGKTQLQAGEFDGAIESFSSYLKAPKPKHAEEATFLRAEALYEQKQYKRAIADYAQFQEKFTKSKHGAAALFKIGSAFLALGSKDDAKAFFQELVDKYPKSAEAKKARAKLK